MGMKMKYTDYPSSGPLISSTNFSLVKPNQYSKRKQFWAFNLFDTKQEEGREYTEERANQEESTFPTRTSKRQQRGKDA